MTQWAEDLCDTSQSKRDRLPAEKGLKDNPGLWVRNSYIGQALYLPALQKGSNKKKFRGDLMPRLAADYIFNVTLPSVGRLCNVTSAYLVFGDHSSHKLSECCLPRGVGPWGISSSGHTSSQKLFIQKQNFGMKVTLLAPSLRSPFWQKQWGRTRLNW